MPERLVELLEAVKPDDQHTDPTAGAIRPAQRLTQRARQLHAVRQPGERIRARLLLIDDRLAAAELDRHQWDPQQREQPEVIVGGREDHRHKRDEHDRGPSVEGEIGAHRRKRIDAVGQRRRRAGQGGVDQQEGRRGRDQCRDPLRIEVLQALAVGKVARQRNQHTAGDGPRDRVLGDVEHEPLDRAAAHGVGQRQRESVHEHHRGHAVREQNRECEGRREGDLTPFIGEIDREQLGDQDRQREQREQRVGMLEHPDGAGDGDDCQQPEPGNGHGRDEAAIGRAWHDEVNLVCSLRPFTTSSERRAPPRAPSERCPSTGRDRAKPSYSPPAVVLTLSGHSLFIGRGGRGLNLVSAVSGGSSPRVSGRQQKNMLLPVCLLAVFASVPVLSGRLGALAAMQLRSGWLLGAALGIQVLVITVLPGGAPALHRVLHVSSYALAGVFVVANRRLRGMLLIGLGGLANLVAIAANGGVMPMSAAAGRTAGMTTEEGFANSAVLDYPVLAPLGDVFAVPGAVFSPGDVAILVGAAMLVHTACGSRLPRRARTASLR